MGDSEHGRRVALVANTSFFLGPALARQLAARGHDLVVGDPQEGLVDELEAAGSSVEVVTGLGDLTEAGAADRLVEAGQSRFGQIDAAVAFTGMIVVGRFVNSTIDDLRTVTSGCIEAPYNFLRAVVPYLVDQGEGQVLVLTSASGARTTPGAPLYSAARAGANHLVRNVAGEVARTGVQANAVGTNFMDFPEFLWANGITDDESRAEVERRVPMRRLGSVEECAAFCCAFLDGTSTFTTGQFVGYAGGWA
jgi:3-oxoacyl-[acyl-carrier protein] reductase